MTFVVKKEVTINDIEKAVEDGLEFVVEDGNLICTVPDED